MGFVQLICLLSLLAAVLSAGDLVRVSYRELGSSESDAVVRIIEALSNDGILAVEGIPGFKQIRRNGLSMADVTLAGAMRAFTKSLPDGTTRTTLGASFNAGEKRHFLELGGALDADTTTKEWNDLQASVDNVGITVASALDAAFSPRESFFGDQTFHSTNGQNGESWDSFSDIMQGGSFLEHVHSYATATNKATDTPNSVDYHTDAGLFILFAPALYTNDVYDRQAKPADFRYQDAQGKEHAIVVQQLPGNSVVPAKLENGVTVHTVSPDTLILMVGQGAVQYLNAPLVKSGSRALRAVPHAVTVTNAGVRNWYGRMYLPPAKAWLTEQQSTHSALRQLLVSQAAGSQNAAVQEIALPVGCGLGSPYTNTAAESGVAADLPAYHSLRALPLAKTVMEDCATGEIYCWAQCQSVAQYNLTCPYSEVTCVDSSGNPTDPSLHISTNQPGCVGQAPTDPGGFCQGNGVNMYMTGFVSYVTGKYRTDGGSTTPGCMVLWFEDWVMDSQGKFAAGCLGVFLLGIWTESITLLRRWARDRTRPYDAAVQTFVMSVLYAVQLMFGYFCMLVAMTYQVELFVCVVLGLGAGHGLFHFKPAQVLPNGKLTEAEKILRAAADLDEVVDPCCQYLSLEDESDHNQRPPAGQNGNGNGSSKGNGNGSARANPMH